MADEEVDWGVDESLEVDVWRRGEIVADEMGGDDEDVLSLGGDDLVEGGC